MPKKKHDILNIILLILIAITMFALNFAKHGNLIIDCGREAYYPLQILQGKVLYKDLFNIYGSFAYLFNAILYKIFGINLNTLYFAGFGFTLIIISTIYLIARRFLSSFNAFSLGFFATCVGICNYSLFNTIFPYSYAMLYGLTFCLLSILFLIKFTDNNNPTNLYISSLLAGLAISNKYDFLPYMLTFLIVFVIKKTKLKTIFYSTLFFLIAPVINLITLFMQGLRLSDITKTINIIKTMSSTQTLKYFYTSCGVYFHPQKIKMFVSNLIQISIPFAFIIGGLNLKKTKNKLFFPICYFISAAYITKCWFSPEKLIFLPIFILIFISIKINQLKTHKALLILILSALLLSLKSFWGMIFSCYGDFFAPILLVCTMILITYKLPFKLKKSTGIFILIFSCIFAINSSKILAQRNLSIRTERGTIKLDKTQHKSTQELLTVLESTPKDSTVLILPEGMLLNFLTKRTTDNYYNSFIPLYIETFDENSLIKYFSKNMPDYIIFNNYNTNNYYFSYIGTDYALNFCQFVLKNYKLEYTINNGFNYLIYKNKKSS